MSTYRTEQKKILMDFLSQNRDRSLTIDEITAGVESSGTTLARSTVYRLVSRLVEDGALRKFVKSDARAASYQLAACEHCESHLHLKCVECGKLFHMDEEISDELVSKIRACSAFSVDEEESVLYGKCSSCGVK